MKGFILKNCTNNNAYTRVGGCSTFEGRPSGFIFTSRDSLFSPDPDEFNREIRDAIYADARVVRPLTYGRATPLTYGIASSAQNGGELNTSQEGWGGTQFTGLSELREDVTITGGGICLYKQLAKLNTRSMRVFRIDNAGMIFGTCVEVDGVVKFRGYDIASFGVSHRLAGDNAGAILLALIYSSNFQKEDIDTHAVQLSGGEIEGLAGLQLKKTGTGKARVFTACDAEDITAIYEGDLAEKTLYKDKSGASPTNVTYAAGELTFTPAAASYRIVDAAALKAAGIEGYEGENEYTDLA